jgi:VIT1/CCC1 family predicted Fe2+/Mn2+ transporter
MPDTEVLSSILNAQRNEITEYAIYERLSQLTKDAHNKSILKQISQEEYAHYQVWNKYSQTDVKPSRLKIWFYLLIARTLGLTFAIKLMEKGEGRAEVNYRGISTHVPEALDLSEDEDRHENELINMIDEERLRYVGSIVRGLNDALVELTGALAGFTLALQNTRLIATAGFILGIAASLSMAASEYLATKSEETPLNPVKSSLYTSSIYFLTVLFLIAPYLIFENVFHALGLTVVYALTVILVFSFYISVAKDIPFKTRFLEMVAISMGITALAFAIGFLARTMLHIEI